MKNKTISWFRHEGWTILIVTVVTVLIWTWAAGEERDSTALSQKVRFFVPDDTAEWVVEPPEFTITATIEGSRQALARAKTMIRNVSVELPAQPGDLTVNLLDRLNAHPEIRRSGVGILAIEPSSEVDLTLDRLVTRQATVRPMLPGVQTQGEVTVNPQVVSLRVPGRVAETLPEDLVVEAFVGHAELEGKQSGVPLTVQGRLRLPPGTVANNSNIRFDQPRVEVSFTMRSIERTITLESVRVQLFGPTEDHEEYVVAIPDPVLTNVAVTADNELIRQIEEGRATVVAVLHLSSRDKEQRITEKRVGGFMAVVHGQPGLRQVRATVGSSSEPPMVQVQITERSLDPSAD